VRNALGLFTLNGAGTGPAVITDANFNVITYTNAARPGQTVIAWGTGLIGVTFPDNQPANVFDFQQRAGRTAARVWTRLCSIFRMECKAAMCRLRGGRRPRLATSQRSRWRLRAGHARTRTGSRSRISTCCRRTGGCGSAISR
ncbi:MAG: hypothetical protein FJW20_20755, partial [Acidimicrobiia bacterium]|nr:hypothetical protein [Acidimicrobiia bacterium]